MLNIETVVNAQTVEIVNDGQDGTAAILRTCGPDDLLDFVNPSSTIADAGLTAPANIDDNDQPVEACTEYSLEPRRGAAAARHQRRRTSAPSTERLLVGDWYNPAGQLESVVPAAAARRGAVDRLLDSSATSVTTRPRASTTATPAPAEPAVPMRVRIELSSPRAASRVILHDASVCHALTGARSAVLRGFRRRAHLHAASSAWATARPSNAVDGGERAQGPEHGDGAGLRHRRRHAAAPARA